MKGTYLHSLDLFDDSVAGLIGDLDDRLVDAVALLTESLRAQDRDSG